MAKYVVVRLGTLKEQDAMNILASQGYILRHFIHTMPDGLIGVMEKDGPAQQLGLKEPVRSAQPQNSNE